MPLFHYQSLTQSRQNNVSLRLFVDHLMQFGSVDDASLTLKKPLPKAIDIFSQSNMYVSISVFWNGHKLLADEPKHSFIVRHFKRMLRLVCIEPC